MLGLPRGEVFLVPWSSEWEKEFSDEKDKINDKIGLNIIDVHHIGSTAVKHLSSKPIIDIAIELKDFSDGEKCISDLESIGYTSHGTNILPGRYYFTRRTKNTSNSHVSISKSRFNRPIEF